MKHRFDNKGSVLLETALIMPVLLLLCFGIVQLAFLIVAKQMTEYAAFCAARAALVYNPDDAPGQAKKAASSVLSWVALSGSSNSANSPILSGLGLANGDIFDRVTVTLTHDKEIPAETANLAFRCHLFVPGVSALLIFFTGQSARDAETAGGFDVYTLNARCSLSKPYMTEPFPKTR